MKHESHNIKIRNSKFEIRNSFRRAFGIIHRKRFGNSSLAFGIIEVLISGVVIITVIGATVSVRQRANTESSFARHQATALMLAQEGMEAVREIRDTNYLAKQKTVNTPFAKRQWDCDLYYAPSITADATASPGGSFYQSCPSSSLLSTAKSPALPTQTNVGDFAYGVAQTQFNTLELGNGMQVGTVFRDDSQSTNTATWLPAWHLSSFSSTFFDGGSSVAGGSENQRADNCWGAERIFVREGTTASANVNPVLENRRTPGQANRSLQDNYLAPLALGCELSVPAGYFEYKRQVIISNGGAITGEVAGNFPANWNGSLIGHEYRALVRVSWKENNRLSVAQDEQGVLLATYLTDWRPNN